LEKCFRIGKHVEFLRANVHERNLLFPFVHVENKFESYEGAGDSDLPQNFHDYRRDFHMIDDVDETVFGFMKVHVRSESTRGRFAECLWTLHAYQYHVVRQEFRARAEDNDRKGSPAKKFFKKEQLAVSLGLAQDYLLSILDDDDR
jgi:hypothetical protein